MQISSAKKLHLAGVVGMNRRNFQLIAGYNDRKLYPLVDNKLRTKEILGKAGLASPKLLGVIKTQSNVQELEKYLPTLPPFVIKPAKGSGGKGILVISEHGDGAYYKPSGNNISINEIRRHASNTLSGLFSLGGNPDIAIIEEMVEFSDAFDGFSYQGVPDIRVIVYRGYPIMAMTRLSTACSDGKANLHQGAVGVGLNMATGHATKAVQFDRPVTKHPDTGARLSDFFVPHWQDFVELASACYEITGLGYLGVDIILDKNRGPMVLELNARPGLAIQMANGAGLQPRVDAVNANICKQNSRERAEWSMQQFA